MIHDNLMYMCVSSAISVLAVSEVYVTTVAVILFLTTLIFKKFTQLSVTQIHHLPMGHLQTC